MGIRFKLHSVAIVAIAAITPLIIGPLQVGGKGLPEVRQAKTSANSDEMYPYSSPRFTSFVSESYREYGHGQAKEFYDWMDNAYTKSDFRYPGKEKLGLEELIAVKRRELQKITNLKKKASAEINLAAWTHRMIKKTIPKFSLDRGFEFHYTVSRGERQCFLQSVLLAGIFQRMGMDAGVVMVNKNITGGASNNGHAVTLLKLPDGNDLIVDCSEPIPFPKHQGLFVKMADYRYVTPVFKSNSSLILGYTPQNGTSKIKTSQVRTLGYNFLRSQFYYYRGERVPNSIVLGSKTPQGLAASEKYLKTSVKLCPENPLAVFTLGRVCYLEHKNTDARYYIEKSKSLYARFGWTPGGLGEYLGLVGNK